MELTEAVQRILRHWRLILGVVAVTMMIPVILYLIREDTYLAFTRMSTGSEATSSQEAEAWVDAARGVVTSPVQVADALDELSVERDPERVAEQKVDVESVGISGVLVLSVSDSDPQVAKALANSLSQRYIQSRREPVIDPLEERLAELDAELAAANKTIDSIDASSESDPAIAYARLVALEEAHQRRSDISSEQRELNATLLSTPKPELIDAATTPSGPESARLFADLMVAGLLGLIIGVAVAAVVEALRPTIIGRDSLARVLGTPLLGEVPYSARLDSVSGNRWLSYRVGLAATEAGVHVVRLTSAGRTVDLHLLAAQLRAAAPQLIVEVVGPERVTIPLERSSLRDFSRGGEVPGSTSALGTWPDSEGLAAGLVVVAPEVLARDDLNEVEYLLAMTDWPLLGLIVSPQDQAGQAQAPTTAVASSPSVSPDAAERHPAPEAAAKS